MSGTDPAKEKVVRHLQEAVMRLHEDIARVELWAGALGCFAQPVPEYDANNTNLNKYMLPPSSGVKRNTGAGKDARRGYRG
jgi:hypothetical protein